MCETAVAISLPTLAERINAEHARCEAAIREGLLRARNVGDLLLQAKAQVPHGKWLPWVRENCKITPRSVQRYMQVASDWERLAGKYDTLSHLTYTAALKQLALVDREFREKPLPTPQNELDVQEKRIERAREGIREAGDNLITIRDRELWRETHNSFESYCETLPLTPDQVQESIRLADESVRQQRPLWQPEEPAPKPHVSHNSGEQEWYTPAEYLDAARQVLGAIDLDPASSEIAQQTVQAAKFYTVADDGLAQPWRGRVWLNPPYSSGIIDQFADKLVAHWLMNEVSAAVVLVNNATETKWFQKLAQQAAALCLPSSRVKFLRPDGSTGAPLQGQCVFYLGAEWKKFGLVFEPLGMCFQPMRPM